jgi:soluble lytic murein transglycosylase-like protein
MKKSKKINRHDPCWLKINAALERRAKVPSGKELALGLGLAMAPAGIASVDAPVSAAPVGHPVGWEHYEGVAKEYAVKHGIPEDMFLRLLRVENPYGDPAAVNPKSGATGLGQFMPGTAEIFKIDPTHPEQSIDASAKYLSELHARFQDWELAVASYNYGPGNISRWIERGSDPSELPAETRAYLSRIKPSS